MNGKILSNETKSKTVAQQAASSAIYLKMTKYGLIKQSGQHMGQKYHYKQHDITMVHV